MMIGLVGKTNVGKSSFFKAATLLDVEIENRKFVTIEPNVGIAYVSFDCVCKEFGVKCNPRNGKCIEGKRFIPVKLIDVAGLVPGAHTGRGLGNKFLDELRRADVLIHVVDFSGRTDEEGNPCVGYDPCKDIEFVEEEIDLWFMSILERAFSRMRNVKKDELIETISNQLSGLGVEKETVEMVVKEVGLFNKEELARRIRRIAKPILIAANKIDLEEAQQNYERIKKMYSEKIIVPTSAEAEIALRMATEKGFVRYIPGDDFEIVDESKLTEAQKNALRKIKQLIQKYGSTGVQQCLDKAVFDLLKYIVVFPVEDENRLSDSQGNVLPDAFLMPPGSTALDLAYKIHTDIGENFVCALDVRTGKKLGRNYELKNRDVIKIVAK